MTGASVLTDIRSMIDFAIGTPEAGVVDFCMLHTVLHCLAQQINALDKPVELLGGTHSVTSMMPARDVQTVAITEYIVETDADTPMKPKGIKPPPPQAETTLLVVERVRKDSSQDQSTASPLRQSTGVRPSTAKDIGRDEAQFFSPQPEEKLTLVTLSRFNLLEEAFNELKDRMYGSMPKNEQILKAVRSQSNMKAITDMWTNLNVSSRIEAAEIGLAKLSSLVEDLIREGHRRMSATSLAAPAAPAQTYFDQTQTGLAQFGPPYPWEPIAAQQDVMMQQLQRLRDDLDLLNQTFNGAISTIKTTIDIKGVQLALPPPPSAPPPPLPAIQQLPPTPTTTTTTTTVVKRTSHTDLTQFGPPYPWETLAAQQRNEREVLVQQLQRLRDDLELLNKTFYDAMKTIQINLDIKGDVQLAPPPPPSEPRPPVIQQLPPPTVPMTKRTSETGLAQFGPPYPWETMAAQQSNERDVMLKELQRLRDDVERLHKTFYDAMKTIQTNIDIKGDVQLALPPPPSAPPPPPPVVQQVPPTAPMIKRTSETGLAQFGPPYPWETMAAQQGYERDVMVQQLQRLRDDLDNLTKTFYDAMASIQNNIDIKGDVQLALPPPPSAPSPPVTQLIPPMTPMPPPPPVTQQIPPMVPITVLAADGVGGHPPAVSRRSSGVMAASATRRSSGVTAALADRLAQLERRVKECCDGMGKDKGVVGDQMGNFQDQLDHLMRQVAALHEDFAVLKLSPNLAKDLEGLMQLYQTVQDMQDQLREVNEVARQLAGEKDDRQNHIKALLEQIEILKTIKMDREDMAEAMAEKADLRMLARKVSHDQFEIACDDLSRGLDHALGKLNTQEALWQQVLDDVQREIESKLDKMELSPLKDFFENKLRMLQENLKQMASLRRNVEAAGSTRPLLRDVNCISCDAVAVMPMENTSVMPSKPLPAHLSMKPYLSYELDAIRKTQASNLPQRNLHDWETIEKQKAQPKMPVKVRSSTDKHICNRYCGGSHTTTTPAQRVARTGHFIKQWGPDVVPLSSGMAAGDDGRLYKVSTAENANVGPAGSAEICTKKPKAPEPVKPPSKPVIITNKECRCLD